MLKKNHLGIPVMLGYTTILLGLTAVFDLSSAGKSAKFEIKGKCRQRLFFKLQLPIIIFEYLKTNIT